MMKPMKRWRSHTLFLRPPTAQAGHEAALAEWAQWCAQNAGSRCELALSSHWVIPCAGAPAQALAQWAHYMELSEATIDQSWVLRSVVAPDLSCIAPRALVEGLLQSARQHAVKLEWVGPWWAWAVQACWQAPPDASTQTLQAFEPGMSTSFKAEIGERGQRTLVQAWTQAHEEGQEPSEATLDSEGGVRIEAGVPADSVLVEWTRPETPRWKAHWAEALDFVGPRVRVAMGSWALLVGALAASMAVAEQAQTLATAQDDVQTTLRRLERAQHQKALALAAPRAASSPHATDPALTPAALKQAARVSQLLAYPWPAVIGRLEQAAQQERAVLMGFSLDINSLGGKLDALPPARLQAALPDDAAALRWVAAHGEGAQLVGRDALATPFDTVQGHYALRAEASWAAGAGP